MPERIRARCHFGLHHDIEVEDDVTAVMEYADGVTATFITSTGEAPGTNRLEIAADRGRVVLEDGRLLWKRNEVPAPVHSKRSPCPYTPPAAMDVEIPVSGVGGQHNGILLNFVDAVLDGKPLIAPAYEGIHSVELANAMLMSAFLDRTVTLPLNASAYARLLSKRIATSKGAEKLARIPCSRKATDASGNALTNHPSYR